jgi:membrane protein DedA with SNARE-associated domain
MQYLSVFFQDFSGTLEQGGYGFLILVVIIEALPLIGTFIPGHVIIILAGFLAKVGILNIWVVFVVTIAAALFGDIMSYIIGKRKGYDFLKRWGRRIYLKDEHFDKAQQIISRHIGKALIFGKFSPITRPYAPFMVGAGGVGLRQFLGYNILGSILWISSSLAVGYIFGASYHAAAELLGTFVVIALIGAILIVWGYRFVNVRFHVFRKYELFVLGLNLVSLFALFKTIGDGVARSSYLANFDISVNVFMAERITPPLAKLASLWSLVCNVEMTLALGLIIGFAFVTARRWRRAAIMMLSVISPVIAVSALKMIFLRSRPWNALQPIIDPSFPSAHATLAAAFMVAFMYVILPSVKSWIKREVLIVLAVLFVISIGLSRLALNVHWASDIIAGWALGIFLATSSVLLVRYVSGLILKDR